jgi:ubiquinone/menaquinone biosynthesis C-methylase UbiE
MNQNQNNTSQTELDQQNQLFWSEPCGTGLARSLGITEINRESLEKFDASYFDFYPYLEPYLFSDSVAGKKILEIGLGFGSVGQKIAEKGGIYCGLDISDQPLKLIRERMTLMNNESYHIVQGSSINLPFENETFDCLYSIGCLHHTGNISQSVQEIHRVLKPGGKTVIMVYNRHSFRYQICAPLNYLIERYLLRRTLLSFSAYKRSLYDAHVDEEVEAPHTDFLTSADIRRLLSSYRGVTIEKQNFHHLFCRVNRQFFLNNLARVCGLDLYVTAYK